MSQKRSENIFQNRTFVVNDDIDLKKMIIRLGSVSLPLLEYSGQYGKLCGFDLLVKRRSSLWRSFHEYWAEKWTGGWRRLQINWNGWYNMLIFWWNDLVEGGQKVMPYWQVIGYSALMDLELILTRRMGRSSTRTVLSMCVNRYGERVWSLSTLCFLLSYWYRE